MKLIVAWLFIFAVACSAEYSKKQIQDAFKVGKQCMKELSIPMDDNVIERIMYNKAPTLKDMRYMYCSLSKFNMLDANDNIIPDKVIEFMVDRYDEQLVRPVIVKCAKQDDPFLYERLWQFHQCFFAEKNFELPAKQCVSELSIPRESDIVERVMYNRNVVGDEITKKYITCVMQKMELIDAEGKILPQVIIDTFKDNYDEELLKPVMKQCSNPQGATLDDRMFAFYACCFEKKTFSI